MYNVSNGINQYYSLVIIMHWFSIKVHTEKHFII